MRPFTLSVFKMLAKGLLIGRVRHRFHSSGERQANLPLYPSVVMFSYDRRIKVYMLLRTEEGLSKSPVLHALNR